MDIRPPLVKQPQQQQQWSLQLLQPVNLLRPAAFQVDALTVGNKSYSIQISQEGVFKMVK